MSDNKKFSDAVLSVVLDAVPEDAKPLGSISGFKAEIWGLFNAVPVGKSITRSNIGKLTGYNMPIGTHRVNPSAIEFNAVKNRLIKLGYISETRTGGKANHEYYYTVIKSVPSLPE